MARHNWTCKGELSLVNKQRILEAITFDVDFQAIAAHKLEAP
jgi:hypothetical protein